MSDNSMWQGRGSGIIIGALLLAVGVLMLLNETVHFGNAWKLWPFFMIIPGINSLMNKGRQAVFSSILLIGMGILFLEMNYGFVGLRGRYFAPIIVLIIGLGLIVDALERRRRRDEPPTGGAS